MKLLIAAPLLAFLNIAAPAVGINPALMKTRLFAKERRSENKHLFQKAQHRRLEDTGDDNSSNEDGDDSADVGDDVKNPIEYYYEDEYYDEDEYYYFDQLPVSGTCLLSTQLIYDSSIFQEYLDNNENFELFDTRCNSAGGQTITMDFEASAECDQPSVSNIPDCLGGTCDQDDIDTFIKWVAEVTYEGEGCSVKTTAVTDGEGDASINGVVPVDCFNGMVDIFYKFYIFDTFLDNVYDEDNGLYLTGDDTEALSMFTSQCSNLGGSMTTSSIDYYGTSSIDSYNGTNSFSCEEYYLDVTSVPFCVSNMCDEDKAQEFVTAFLESTFSPVPCEGTKITIDDKMITEIDSPKMPKSSKMPKTPKTPKSSKTPKTPKMPKSLKMPKARPKYPKVAKAPSA